MNFSLERSALFKDISGLLDIAKNLDDATLSQI